MKYLINTSSLTGPTAETVKLEIENRFKKILRLMDSSKAGEFIKITVSHNKNTFEVHVEAFYMGIMSLTIKDTDLRSAISQASLKLKRVLSQKKNKIHDNTRRYREFRRFENQSLILE